MTQHLIKSFPSLDLRNLARRRDGVDPVLGNGSVALYASGRSALFHLLKSIATGAGDTVLLPSYHCGVEVEAALRAGWQASFYRIKKDLSLDLDHLIGAIDGRTKAIFVVHYFGFPQQLQALQEVCRDKGVMLIEDCAHALYSQGGDRQWLGTKGDFAIFSMRKTSFVPNGGAVLVNRKGAPLPGKGRKHFELSMVKTTVRAVLEHEITAGGVASAPSRFVLHLFERRSADARPQSDADDHRWYYDVPLFHYEHDISAVSLLFWGQHDYSQIIESRRHNYLAILKRLSPRLKEALLFPDLPDGVCPLCLPMFADDRDATVSLLTERGVEPFVFGRMLHPLIAEDAFPDAHYLSDSIIGLPVHQQLSERDLETISDVVLKTIPRQARS